MLRSSTFLAAVLITAPLFGADDARTLWNNKIQQLLDANCVKCHGPLKQKSGLELDTVEGVLKGSENGPIVDSKKPDTSVILDALKPGSDPHMPPKKQLTDDEVAAVKTWVTALASAPPTEKAAPLPPPPDGTDIAGAIDYYLDAGWKSRNVTPTALCDDSTFLRRVYLDLAGRIPKPEEADAFLTNTDPKKREKLVDQLLASPEYPVTFREVWDALLMGRHSGRREGSRRGDGWFAFLERAFKDNRPWNDVVHAFIAARPDKPEDKGAGCFLFERKNDFQQIAESVAPIIYGTRIDCAQCHDHPLAREIKQAHYWGLVAAFNRGKNVEKAEPNVAESAIGGFMNFTNLKKESQPAVITMLTGKTIDETRPAPDVKEADKPEDYIDPNAKIKVPKFSRRGALADAATIDNPLLARAFVNYTWAYLFGRGIVFPVDEMNSKHPPSHPEMLDWLAADFASHHYDIRREIRGIVLSRGYQLAASTATPALPPEAFAAATEKPLIAEAILRSMRITVGRDKDMPELHQVFADSFPDVLPRVEQATTQQAMFFTNSDQFTTLFQPVKDTAAAQIGALPTPEERVRATFRRALVREPDADELTHSVAFLAERKGDPADAVSQLLWALVTGPEFLTNH